MVEFIILLPDILRDISSTTTTISFRLEMSERSISGPLRVDLYHKDRVLTSRDIDGRAAETVTFNMTHGVSPKTGYTLKVMASSVDDSVGQLIGQKNVSTLGMCTRIITMGWT